MQFPVWAKQSNSQMPSLVTQFFLSLLMLFGAGAAIAQSERSAQSESIVDQEMMHRVMRGVDSFSEKAGEPPVYRAYRNEPGSAEPVLIGYLFETPDLPPEEVGYSAPIDVLVGVDLEGTLTGMEVLYYRESYKSIRGDFINTEQFPFQFKGKNLAEDFRVGRDIDGISRATITSWAVARGIRNAARRLAMAYLSDSKYVTDRSADAIALRVLEAQSWQDMIDTGLIKQFEVIQTDLSHLDLAIGFIGHDGLGELMVGADDYSRADREASNRVRDGNMVMVGIDGNSSQPFRQERLAIQQGEEIFQIPRQRFVYVGSADNGKIKDQVRFAGAMVLDTTIDISKPFTIYYNNNPDITELSDLPSMEYQVPPVALSLALGTELPAEFIPFDESGADELNEGSVFSRLINSAPWFEVLALLILLAMVMTAFLRKSEMLRWITLAFTFVYLGFIDGTFLSVSHISNGIKLGPSLFSNDLPLLLIVVFTLVTTLFWGRVFCSSLCPFGALQDFISKIVPKRWQKELPQAIHDKALYIKYAVLALLIVMTLAYSELSIFQYFEPFGTLFYQSQSVLLWSILLAFLLASTFVSRFYCRYACPLGAALGVASLISPWRIARVEQCQVCKVCEHACPTGAIRGPDIDFKECVRCDICESKLITRSGVCKHSVEEVAARHKTWTPVTVS